MRPSSCGKATTAARWEGTRRAPRRGAGGGGLGGAGTAAPPRCSLRLRPRRSSRQHPPWPPRCRPAAAASGSVRTAARPGLLKTYLSLLHEKRHGAPRRSRRAGAARSGGAGPREAAAPGGAGAARPRKGTRSLAHPGRPSRTEGPEPAPRTPPRTPTRNSGRWRRLLPQTPAGTRRRPARPGARQAARGVRGSRPSSPPRSAAEGAAFSSPRGAGDPAWGGDGARRAEGEGPRGPGPRGPGGAGPAPPPALPRPPRGAGGAASRAAA